MVHKADFARVIGNLTDGGVHGTVIKRLQQSQNVDGKSERVKLKIGELKSSVSELTLSTVEMKEEAERKERQVIIRKFLKVMNFISDSDVDQDDLKQSLDLFNLSELRKHIRALEKMYEEEGGDLDELYDGIESGDMRGVI